MYLKLAAVFTVFMIFVQNSLQEEWDPEVYSNCQFRFQPRPGMCNKFNFISSEDAVKKGCIIPKNGTTFYDLSELPAVETIDPHTVKMASMITNVFEDGDPNFSYGYCSDIHDSRGFTSGYVGFTTGTGDAETLISLYSEVKPNNTLDQFLPRCRQLSQLPHCDRKNRGSTFGLETFCTAWRNEACQKNSLFSKLQREWVYTNYMIPSARYAAQNGIQSPLGQAIFYDTIIQHGYQYVEPDINIVRIIAITGPRLRHQSEQEYLTQFLITRRELQCCYPDQVWPASASRVADLQALVDDFSRNKDLKNPVHLKTFGRVIYGDEDITVDKKHCK